MFLSVNPGTLPGWISARGEMRSELGWGLWGGGGRAASCYWGEIRDAPWEGVVHDVGRGVNPQRPMVSAHNQTILLTYLSMSFPKTLVQGEVLGLNTHPLFLFPGLYSSLPGLALEASTDVFSTVGL